MSIKDREDLTHNARVIKRSVCRYLKDVVARRILSKEQQDHVRLKPASLNIQYIKLGLLADIPQKNVFACGDCGCMYTIKPQKGGSKCPVCKSEYRDRIEVLHISY